MTDPRVQQLASEAAQKIKTVTSQRNAEIEQIYQDFRTKADAIQGTSDSLSSSADSQSPNHLLEDS